MSFPLHLRRPLVVLGAAAAVGLVACGGSSNPKTTAAGAVPSTATGAAAAGSPGTMFSTADVSGLGTVVVDGQRHTVYLLRSGNGKNVPCDDASGCTKVWPDLALPAGTAAATAGTGLQASLLGTVKLADGETYPTYGGWLMYEYVGDNGPAQAHGQGLNSFGGTWSAITPAGAPATPATATPTSSGSGSGTDTAGY
jgi:predicted lipoprotein with Yx(FWY)xxD motif